MERQYSKTSDPAEGGVEDFILIFVKPVQPPKQKFPKLVTELGIVIEVKPVQLAYLYVILYQ